jgi:thiol-disulfide isomerase/thioredoxin
VVLAAALVGLLAARAGHVAVQADASAAQPLAALDVRDGGWLAPLGLLAGLGWLAWRGWHWREGQRALAGAALAGVALWGALQAGVLLYRAGHEAGVPAVTLTSLADGRERALAEVLAGRPAVVNLWATWCAPCRAEMPVLAAAQQQHPEIVFVFANQGESAETVRRYLAREGLALREVWMDPRSQLGPALGSRGLPTTVFYSAAGRRVEAHMGVLNAAALQGHVQRLQRVRPPG